jgi:hypothetical protein
VGFFREMRLDGKRLYGPDRELVSFPDAFRGSVGGARISINRVEPNRFRGTTDGSDGHVDLRVEPAADPGVVQVKGFWGGAPFGAFASPAKLSARGNKCPVVLDRVPGSQPPRYTGVDPCSHQPVEAMLPASYFELPLEDRALFLAFFLR